MKPQIAIVGEFQIGKSTLVNCLLRKKVATVGEGLPTTMLPIKYCYGEEEKVVGKNNSTIKVETTLANFMDPAMSSEWLNCNTVEIFLRNQVLETMNIIDTPGLDANEQDTNNAILATQMADMAILLMTKGFPAGKQSFIEFIRQVLIDRPYILLLNCGREPSLQDPNSPACLRVEEEICVRLENLGLSKPFFQSRVNLGWLYKDWFEANSSIKQRSGCTENDLLINSGFTTFQNNFSKMLASLPSKNVTPLVLPNSVSICYCCAIADSPAKSVSCCDGSLCKYHALSALKVTRKGKLKFKCPKCKEELFVGYPVNTLSSSYTYGVIECNYCCDRAVGTTICCDTALCRDCLKEEIAFTKNSWRVKFSCPCCHRKWKNWVDKQVFIN